MNHEKGADLSWQLSLLEKSPVFLTKEMVAKALGIATHCVPPLVRAGLLKPLGRPGRYCVKYFSRQVLAQNMADEEWLSKVVNAINRHWQNKNSRRRRPSNGKSNLLHFVVKTASAPHGPIEDKASDVTSSELHH